MSFESTGFRISIFSVVVLFSGSVGCGNVDDQLESQSEAVKPVFNPVFNPPINVTSGWLGGNCAEQTNHSGPLDITGPAGQQMNGKLTAAYTATGLTDPARGCDKNLIINYRCGGPSVFAQFASFVYHAPEAMNRTTSTVDCTGKTADPVGGHNAIRLDTAYYAANYVPGGVNVMVETPSRNGIINSGIRSGVQTVCDGASHCDYYIEYKLWGPDPAPGKDKDFHASYHCTGDNEFRHFDLGGEANHHTIHLDCATP